MLLEELSLEDLQEELERGSNKQSVARQEGPGGPQKFLHTSSRRRHSISVFFTGPTLKETRGRRLVCQLCLK